MSKSLFFMYTLGQSFPQDYLIRGPWSEYDFTTMYLSKSVTKCVDILWRNVSTFYDKSMQTGYGEITESSKCHYCLRTKVDCNGCLLLLKPIYFICVENTIPQMKIRIDYAVISGQMIPKS